MAEHFVKIYGSILSSSIWLEDEATRLVWITMLAKADEDGCVWASVGGLAHAARVSKDKCRKALEVLSGPDEDSRDPDNDGRRIEKIHRGWRVLNREKYAKMRTRKQIRTAQRVAEWRERQRSGVTGNDVTTDQVSTSISSSPPKGDQEKGSRGRARGEVAHEGVQVVHSLSGWEPPEGLEDEALAAGVPREVFRERLAELGNGPIGGRRGVLAGRVTDYVRRQFGKWRTWHEEQRARGEVRATRGRIPNSSDGSLHEWQAQRIQAQREAEARGEEFAG